MGADRSVIRDILELAEHDKDEDDNKYEAYASSPIIAGSIEGTTAKTAETAKQCDDEYDKKDCADRHCAPKV